MPIDEPAGARGPEMGVVPPNVRRDGDWWQPMWRTGRLARGGRYGEAALILAISAS